MYNFLVNKFQIGYEYLLDNYGVMKGTIMLLLITISILADINTQLALREIYVINLIATLLLVWQSITYRTEQLQGQYNKINIMASAHRRFPLLISACLLFLLYLVWSSIFISYWEGVRVSRFMVNAPLIPYVILIGVYVRDPEQRYEEKLSFNGA